MGALIGIDWGCGAHAVCVIDAEGKTLDRFEVGHDREGLAALFARLGKHGPARALAIAVERPSGLLVDTLVEAGFIVTPIHLNVVKACRPRYRAVAAKSDPGDAFILADILRFWPGAARIFADLASPIALAFLERYPTPESAARLGPKRLAGFLAQHHYCGRRAPETLLERLRAAPRGRAGEAEGAPPWSSSGRAAARCRHPPASSRS